MDAGESSSVTMGKWLGVVLLRRKNRQSLVG